MDSRYNRHIFRSLSAAVMMCLAVAVILLHAFVPHHHHDCGCDLGLVYETEVACHCDDVCGDDHDCHEHHSHHPFDFCKLQDLLSHLVLSNKSEETYLALNQMAEVDLFIDLNIAALLQTDLLQSSGVSAHFVRYSQFLPHTPHLDHRPLRAPPVCA